MDSRAIEWYRRLADPPRWTRNSRSSTGSCGNTSHSGRLTGVSIGCQLGASHEVLRTWMIVVSTTTVVTYVRRGYSVGAIGRSLMEFLRDKA